MSDVVKLRFLGRFVVRGGALYNAGERAAFPPDLAEQALASGVAVLDEPAAQEASMPAKQEARPPMHKQVKGAPNKGGRRG